MFTLIGLGVSVAYGYSLVAAVFPGVFPETLRGAHGGVDVYFEAAAVIVTLVLLGQVMELRARGRTSAALRSLLKLAPATARRVLDDGEEDISLERVRKGIGFASGLAKRFPWMAWWSKGAARWMSPW